MKDSTRTRYLDKFTDILDELLVEVEERGYEDGEKAATLAAEDAIEKAKDSLSMTYSCGRDGLYTAALRDQPAVFETGLTILEAVGRLTCRVLTVTRLGYAPVAA